MGRILIVPCFAVLLLAAYHCSDEPGQRLGVEGASCVKTADCESPLQCIKNVCTNLAGPEDVQPETVVVLPDGGRPPETSDLSSLPEATVTDSGDVEPNACASNGDCAVPTPVCDLANGVCVECLLKAHCPPEMACSNGKCVEGLCEPSSKWCEGGIAIVCNDKGTGYASSTNCGEQVCIDGECKGCTPGHTKCDGATIVVCTEAGTGYEAVEECTEGVGCANGQCVECYPGDKECFDNDAHSCKQDGSGWELEENCAGVCIAGLCVSPCVDDPKLSNVGCDYWAVDLDNAAETDPMGITHDAENQQFAVVVSNTSADSAAEVTVSSASGVASSATVQPGALYTFQLPAANAAGSMKAKVAYRIESTVPIVAYQFNPLVNAGVFSNDASLLLPVHSLGTDYLAVSHIQDDPVFKGYITVVGVEEGETNVTIIPAGAVAPGNGVSGVPAGTPMEVTLQQYEVLNLVTAGIGEDLTGTRISADKKVAVFGGSECGYIPVVNYCEGGSCQNWPAWSCIGMDDCPSICCCDHMEQQIIPIHAWGKEYAVAHSKFRGNESDSYVLMAAEDGTSVDTDPVVTSVPELEEGEWFAFEAKQDFELTANKPVLLVQWLASEQAPNAKPDTCGLLGLPMCATSGYPCQTDADCPSMPEPGDAGTGDPAMILLPALEQFRSEYVFLVPQYYYGGNYLSLVSETGTVVTLDNNLVSPAQFVPFGAGDYSAARVSVTPGPHKVTADKPIGVMVHGYDQYVSYGYSAGMNVQVLP